MLMETTRKLFTADEYFKMARVGLFDDQRVELIEGEIIELSPIGHPHEVSVNRANAFFTEAFGRTALVSIQNSMKLNWRNVPQPDVVVFKPRDDFYDARRPTPEDVLFVVEVSDSSFRKDRNIKLPLFAAAGIPEAWIEDLQHDSILVFREPEGRSYRTQLTFRLGDSITPIAFPNFTFRVDDLLGEPVAEKEAK